jgi:peptide/nickel transport system substrate-binding protein
MADDRILRPWGNIVQPTRRGFIAGSLATGLGAAGMRPGASLAADAAPAPVKGGHLRLGLGGGSTADTLNPSNWGDTFMTIIGYAVRGGLTAYGADGTLEPDVAASWEAADGAKRWIFKLQKSASFSDGRKLTADDVVASLNFHRGPKSASGAKAIFEQVTDIKADDPETVIVTLSSGIVDFAYSLTDQHINIMPASSDGVDWRSGIGAGPYILDHFEPGVRAVLRRNPDSYKAGHLESAELLSVPDVVARQAALLTGKVDAINRADPKTVNLLKQRPGLRVEQSTGRLNYWLVANTTADPFTSADVRTALKYGIDREGLLKTVFNGFGSVGNDQPITPDYRYHDPSIAAKTYDPDKARFFLKKAGHDSLSVDFHVSDAAFGGAVDLAVLYQQQAAKAGIAINVVREPTDGYWAKIYRSPPPWYATFWAGRATEDTILTVSLAANSPWNYSRWANPDFNRALVQARQEVDEAKRLTLYSEAQHLASEDGGAVIPIFANSVFALHDKVQHPAKLAGNWELDGARLIERWWVA